MRGAVAQYLACYGGDMHELFNFRCAKRDLRHLRDICAYERRVTARTVSISDLLREAVRAYVNMRISDDPELQKHIVACDRAHEASERAERAQSQTAPA